VGDGGLGDEKHHTDCLMLNA